MWDLFYYLAGISAVGTVGFGVLYFYDRDTADEISREIGWNAVKAYHKINLEYDNLKRWYDQQIPVNEMTTVEQISKIRSRNLISAQQ